MFSFSKLQIGFVLSFSTISFFSYISLRIPNDMLKWQKFIVAWDYTVKNDVYHVTMVNFCINNSSYLFGAVVKLIDLLYQHCKYGKWNDLYMFLKYKLKFELFGDDCSFKNIMYLILVEDLFWLIFFMLYK